MATTAQTDAVGPDEIHLAHPRFSALLRQLHRASDFDSLFLAGEELLRATMPLYHLLAALPCVGYAPMFLRTSLPVPDLPDYWGRFYRARPPLADIIEKHPGIKLAVLSRHVDEEALLASSFYTEFMQPDGWRYSAGFLFWEGMRFRGQFSFIRTPEQGDFTAQELTVLEALYPHFDEVVRRIEEIDQERSQRRSLEAALNATAEGRIILDWNLRLVYRNRPAIEACAAWRSGSLNSAVGHRELARLFVLPEEIATASSQLLAEFSEAVRQDLARSGVWQVSLPHSSIPGLSARIRILETGTPQAVEPSVLVELSRLGATTTEGRAWPTHTLTASERRVAELAATGESNEQIAGSLGVSVHTIRAHLREVFSKLGVGRRQQLSEVMRD